MRRVKNALLLVTMLALLGLAFAACEPSSYRLSASASPDAGGTVSPSSGTYEKGVTVDVTATPAPGYRFDHWEGGASGAFPTVRVTVDSNTNLVAYFTKTYTLSASASPGAGGSVSPTAGTYDEGSEVTLAATPTQYYRFNGWAGDASGISDHVTITMDSNKSVVASFAKLTYAVQAQVDASGGGTVDPTSGTLEAGTHASITATPASGYRFDHWGGSASGTSNPLSLLINGNKTVTAYFTRVYSLSVSCSPSGSCTFDPNGGVFDEGANVPLTAVPLFPYAFDHWTGTNNDAVNPTTVTMDSDKSAVAYLTELTPGTLQTTTGIIYNTSTPKPKITLQAGEWVEVGVVTDISTQVVILDPYSGVVKDLGTGTNFTWRFQAQKTGDYAVSIAANFITYVYYTVTYTVYS